MLVWIWTAMDFFDHHEGTAAWVQAIGAITIIFATALIASRNSREIKKRERNAKEQLWKSVVALARSCLNAIDGLLKNYPLRPTSDRMGDFLRSHVQSDFDVPMGGLAAVPLQQVGNAALVTAILNLRSVMGRIQSHLDDVRASKGVMPLSRDIVQTQRALAFNAVTSILRIAEGPLAEDEISRLENR